VKIDESAIAAYAAGLPSAELPPPNPATYFTGGDREGQIAFVVCLDAINFGSGWWPEIRKRPGHSGYFTIAAGLNRAGVAVLREEDRLTAFADNLVPHVLRLDRVLYIDPELEARIDAGELLVHGSAEEVELRACAVHAIELLGAAAQLSPAQIDGVLWNRGRAERYKSVPRPRCRSTAY
jgi:hypothetical protein